MSPWIIIAALAVVAVGIFLAIFANGSRKAAKRRLAAIKTRRGGEVEARRTGVIKAAQADRSFTRLLQSRLDKTGKPWTVQHYLIATVGLIVTVTLLLVVRGIATPTAVGVGVAVGAGLPWLVVGRLASKRAMRFITRFPDAIDLLVRGLRSGLPISETIGVVGNEVADPVGAEFRSVADKMKIGRTMEGALQDTADRLQTPEFQFFVISLAIQRETGGNLAETLGNLSDVLRKRMQMKLKVRAMSSESKASAYIIGALPFIVFGLIYYINPEYMMNFFTDQRLIYAGIGGGVWMGIGAFIMAKMISFEI